MGRKRIIVPSPWQPGLFDPGNESEAPELSAESRSERNFTSQSAGKLDCYRNCNLFRHVVAAISELAGAEITSSRPEEDPSPLPQVIYLPRQCKKHSFDDEALAFLKELYFSRPRARAADLERCLRREAARRGWKIGSRASVYRVIKGFAI
jgi:hypothetical protein